MLSGDLGFDDIFSDKNIEGLENRLLIPANFVIIVFVITVVLVLHNLLISLSVNDTKVKIKQIINVLYCHKLCISGFLFC